MQTVLNKFISGPLYDASANMLKHLKIKFSPQSKAPIPFENLYSAATSQHMPKQLDNVMAKVEDSYFIGTIDEDSLQGHQNDYDLENPKDSKYLTIMVFAVEIRHGESLTRSELAMLTRGFNRLASSFPIILFVKNGDKLSLSTCERSEYQQEWREGEKLGKVSILRDINCLKPHRGHLDILETLGDKAYPTFDELYKHWLEVFSSELLTKKFYTELSEWYAWVIGSGKVKFPNDISTTEDDAKFNHESTIRLITRLIFVWFLKQKNLIPEDFFNEDAIRDKFIENFDPHSEDTLFYNPDESKYYRLILQNLFFAMLNRPIKDEESGNDENRRFVSEKRFQGKNDDYNINNLLRYRSEFKDGGADKLLELANSQVPFLNGGLFECLDNKDNGLYYDGFSERKASLEQLSFPDYFFFGEEVGKGVDLSGWYDDKKKKCVNVRGLINILKRYNFTVEENTPLDQEVSLDPELLGKVFENLLASYNPETNTTARKQTGSFYTPRAIVQFMVDESLIAHLKKTCPEIEENALRSLFDYSIDATDLHETDRKLIMSALYNCKVLDPACGSGAYPMGILQQMVHALRKLDPSNEMWKEFLINITTDKTKKAYYIADESERSQRLKDINDSFNRQLNDPDYARKLYLIENCIYGVDIQPIATQISKLRFFISLVAEQKPNSDASTNFGIRPLPNLEAKFVSANSLISLEKEQNIWATSDRLDEIKKELEETNHQIFIAKRNKVKRALRAKIEQLQSEYADELVQIGSIGESSAEILAGWKMFDQNSTAEFFDPEWMFGMNRGFDIVIGNPPYVQLQKATGEKGYDKKGKLYDVKLGDLYEGEDFETFAKTGDIYCLFYEQGYNLVDEGGIVCYITSNKWMRAGYGEKLRGFFAKKTNPEVLIDFGGIQVFESATVDTNILLFSKAANQGKTLSTTIGKQKINGFLNLSIYLRHNAAYSSFNTSDSWVILSPIEQNIKRKIEAVGVPLKDWDIQINYGIKTGFNDAFIINEEKRQEILSNCQTEEERQRTDDLIRPILRGRDIKRYGYDWAGLYLIATFPSRNYDIEQYPAVKAHLLSYGLERLEQTGKEHIVNGEKIKSRKKTNNKWFETQDSISYWEDFNSAKIAWPSVGATEYSFIPPGYVLLDTNYFIALDEYHGLLAFLNSSLIKWWICNEDTKIGDGGAYRHYKYNLEKLPVSIKFNDFINEIDELVNKSCSPEVEEKINAYFYALYNLTEEERIFLSKNE